MLICYQINPCGPYGACSPHARLTLPWLSYPISGPVLILYHYSAASPGFHPARAGQWLRDLDRDLGPRRVGAWPVRSVSVSLDVPKLVASIRRCNSLFRAFPYLVDNSYKPMKRHRYSGSASRAYISTYVHACGFVFPFDPSFRSVWPS